MAGGVRCPARSGDRRQTDDRRQTGDRGNAKEPLTAQVGGRATVAALRTLN